MNDELISRFVRSPVSIIIDFDLFLSIDERIDRLTAIATPPFIIFPFLSRSHFIERQSRFSPPLSLPLPLPLSIARRPLQLNDSFYFNNALLFVKESTSCFNHLPLSLLRRFVGTTSHGKFIDVHQLVKIDRIQNIFSAFDSIIQLTSFTYFHQVSFLFARLPPCQSI